VTSRPPSAEDPHGKNEALRQENETLRRRLAEAEQVNEVLTKGQIDAVVDAARRVPLLLRQAQEALEGALPHAGRVGEAHVVGHQRFHLHGFFARETQPAQDAARESHPGFHVAIEADAAGDAERGRLAYVVQQRA